MVSHAGEHKRLESVLCIEDDEDVQRIVEISLQRIGKIRVHLCADPRLALDRARELAPDLILLDYLMPGLDGAAVLKLLQADPDLVRIPVIFLTASATKANAEMLGSLGAAGVLFKPFNVRELPQKILAIWNGMKQRCS
jgi:CheY-like chemotaxis protein